MKSHIRESIKTLNNKLTYSLMYCLCGAMVCLKPNKPGLKFVFHHDYKYMQEYSDVIKRAELYQVLDAF